MRLPGTALALLGALLALLLAGCGSDDQAAPSPGSPETTGAEPAKQAEDGGTDEAEVYFTAGEQFRKVEREIPEGEDELTAAAEALVAGPTPREAEAKVETRTQIPAATEVEDVSLADDGTAVVALSPEFTAGIPDEPGRRSRAEEAELNARLGQVTYTLTQFPDVERTKVVAGGTAVEPSRP